MVAIGSISSNALVSSADIDAIFLTYGNEHNRVAGFLPAGNAAAVASASATPGALALRDAAGGLTSAYGIHTPNGGVAGVTVLGGTSFTSPAISYSKTGQAAFFQVNNDASVNAPAFHGPADTALALAVGATISASAIGQGALTDDKQAGLWYTASATAMKVHVAGKNVWNQGSFIQFGGLDSPAISTTGLLSGQARLDLLYMDQSGALNWQQGTPGAAASPPFPANPNVAFVPIEIHKTYFGATTVTGYSDLGHDSCMLYDARLPTTPFSSSAISAHSLSLTRLLEGAVYATNPASTTINAAALSYYNSGNAQIDYPGGVYTYANSALLNSQPRWDLLYNDDAGNLSLTQGTPAASPSKPTFSTGQWPRALIYIPPNCTTIMDEAAYLAAGSPAAAGYIHFVPAYLAGNAPNAAATSATGTLTTSGSSPNIAVTAVNVTLGGGPYAVAPAVVFNGGTGTAATATANLLNGVVTSVTVNTPGAYTVAPTSVTFSATGGILPLGLGGTAATTAAAARTNLGAAASGTNGDILVLNGLTGVAGNVTYTGNSTFQPTAIGNVPLVSKLFSGQTADALQVVDSTGATVLANVTATGSGGFGGLVGANTRLLLAGTLAGTLSAVNGLNQTMSLKPASSGGSAIFANLANGGTVDMSALTANGANVLNAYGLLVNPITRATSNPSVFAIDTLTPTGTVSGGNYTVSDGTNTSASINATDGIAAINTALTFAGGARPAAINYTAAGAGSISGGNVITFTATTANPGKQAAMTVPFSGVTGGGSIAMAQTYAGAAYIPNVYGVYAKTPTGGQQNVAIYANGQIRADPTNVDASLFAGFVDYNNWAKGAAFIANKVMNTNVTNDSVATIQGSASGETGFSEKALLSIFGTQNNDSTTTAHDFTGLELQTYGGAGISYSRQFVMHLQSNFNAVSPSAPGTDGNSVIIEAQILNPASDGQYIGQGTLFQKGGIAMFAGGPQNATFAFLAQTGPPGGRFWHAYYVDPAGLVVDNNHGGAFHLAGLFNVKHTGTVGVGTDVPRSDMTGVGVDVRGDIRSTKNVRFSTASQNTTLATSGNIDPANGQVQRFALAGSVTGINILPPPTSSNDGGGGTGSTPLLILINESSTNTIAFNAVFNSSTNAVLNPVTMAARSAQVYIWDTAAGSYYKVV